MMYGSELINSNSAYYVRLFEMMLKKFLFKRSLFFLQLKGDIYDDDFGTVMESREVLKLEFCHNSTQVSDIIIN